MDSTDRIRTVSVGTSADGTLTYMVDAPPEALPAVSGRDIARAWEAARAEAFAQRWGVARGFRFRRDDGSFIDLSLADRDARTWASAIDRLGGMQTSYGIALCLRLLALVELLTRAAWARPLLTLRHGDAELHPTLLYAAATVPLTAEARFDEAGFRARLAQRTGPLPAAAGASR